MNRLLQSKLCPKTNRECGRGPREHVASEGGVVKLLDSTVPCPSCGALMSCLLTGPPSAPHTRATYLCPNDCAEPTDGTTACPNPYCHDGWVGRGDNESGGAPAFACKTCHRAEQDCRSYPA